MKKLVLNVEELEVASFDTSADALLDRGTVQGNSDERTIGCSGELICTDQILSYLTTC
ncbi:MAG TPA: hypothetical protein VEQ60_22435 [Longimicrobium sp.]|nr:hypothetical protein [Longimicrobium sp.]